MKYKKKAQSYERPLIHPNKRAKPGKLLQLVTPITNQPFKSNLPLTLTPFVDRQTEVEAICSRLADPAVRLVTLCGTAGLGKTRLSLVVGEKLQNNFRDGVFFVNLAPLTRPEVGLTAIARALGLQDQSALPLLERLQNYLQKRSVLLILDNFEQIISLSPAISELLQTASRLKVLVTSRVILHLYGEHVYTVPALRLPVLSSEDSFEALCQNEAVRLFSQCASMVNPAFRLTEENIEPVARLCNYLEGLPLAIELAAARCNVFSPQTLLERLSGSGQARFELLVDGFSNLPPRQQTLANALEWSYRLLNETEKQLFRRLGIFADGWSLTAAQALDKAGNSTLETLVSLLNKSLVKQVKTQPDEDLRFTMLETLREYALKKLEEAGELTSVRTTYTNYFIEMVEASAERVKQPDYLNWLKLLLADHTNILNVLDFLIESKNAERAFRLGGSIWVSWWRWGYLSQGRQWLDKILTLESNGIKDSWQARILEGAAYLAMYQCDYRTAETYFEQSIAIWRETGTTNQLGQALSGLAGAYRILGNYEKALQLNYECLEIFRARGDESNIADSLCNIGWQLMERGNYEPVQAILEESLALHTKIGYFSGMGRVKIYLGDFLWRKNNPAAAIDHLEEAIGLLKKANHLIRLPALYYRLGLVHLCEGHLEIAEKFLEESVEIGEKMHKPLDLTYAYSSLGLLRLVQNELVQARALFEQSLSYRAEIGQHEGILWALEGLTVLALEQDDCEKAEKLLEEARLLRQVCCAPVLPHTLKFIWPKLTSLQSQKEATSPARQLEPAKPAVNLLKLNPAIRPVPVPITATAKQNSAFNFAADCLSQRENEVLKLLAQGYRNIQIAETLVISPGTVNNHLTSIYSKLGVNSRTAAIRYAIDHNLL